MTSIGPVAALALAVGLVAASCGDQAASPTMSTTPAPATEPAAPAVPAAPSSMPPTTTATIPPTNPATIPPTSASTTPPTTTPPLPSFSSQSALLFDQAVLHEVAIEIAEDDLALLDPPTDDSAWIDPPTYDRVPVRLTVDGVTVDAAGLRLKRGWGQFQGLDRKPGFSIETDEFVDDLLLFDVDRFTLGNATWDHSFVNEPLVYGLYAAAGIPAPRTALARVTVNGEPFGLYVMRETIKKRMLAQHFADPTGNLYESTGAHDAPDMGLELRTNKRTDDTSDLDALMDVVESAPGGEFRAAIEEHVDVDQLLTYWALEALVGHHDGYAYDLSEPGLFPDAFRPPNNPYPNNFYVYHDPTTDRFVFLPHGTDMTLGMGAWSNYDVDPSAPVLRPPKATGAIAPRLWEDPAFQDEFADRIRQLLDEVWDVPAMTAQADRLAELVRTDGLTGTRETVTIAQFEEALASRTDFLSRRADAVRAELAASASVAAQSVTS